MPHPTASPIAWHPTYPQRTPPALWGDGHWRMLQHVEERCVSNAGTLSPEWLRINPATHYQQAAQQRAALGSEGHYTPTIIKAAPYPATDGTYAHKALLGHDEYDCLDDLVHANYIDYTWPTLNSDGSYAGPWGVVQDGSVPLTPRGLRPGDVANHLIMHAVWTMRERGWVAAHQFRRHVAQRLDPQDFLAPVDPD